MIVYLYVMSFFLKRIIIHMSTMYRPHLKYIYVGKQSFQKSTKQQYHPSEGRRLSVNNQ